MEKKRISKIRGWVWVAFTCGLLGVGAGYLRAEISPESLPHRSGLVLGAERTDVYVPILRDKRVGMVINNTSLIAGVRSVDSLRSLGINVVRAYSIETGTKIPF